MNGLVRLALHVANVPDDLVAEVQKDAPAAGRVLAAAQKLKPDLELLAPIIARMAPTIKEAWPDVVAILPAAQKVEAFVEALLKT